MAEEKEVAEHKYNLIPLTPWGEFDMSEKEWRMMMYGSLRVLRYCGFASASEVRRALAKNGCQQVHK